MILLSAFFINSSSQKEGIEANNSFQSALSLYETGDSEGALKGFLATVEQYPGQGISNISLYYAALINFNNGNYGESVKLLNNFECEKEMG